MGEGIHAVIIRGNVAGAKFVFLEVEGIPVRQPGVGDGVGGTRDGGGEAGGIWSIAVSERAGGAGAGDVVEAAVAAKLPGYSNSRVATYIGSPFNPTNFEPILQVI